LPISETANERELVLQLTHRIDKVARRFDTFRGGVLTRLHFLEEKLEDRFTYPDPKRLYVEKYGKIEQDKSLLTTDLARDRWRAYGEMPISYDVPKLFHDAFGAGYFKLVLFMQDKRHWDVPSKEKVLWNWLKNQRVSMREYERGTKVNHFTQNPRYYEILKHDCGVRASKMSLRMTSFSAFPLSFSLHAFFM
jgi:hypothetical protein